MSLTPGKRCVFSFRLPWMYRDVPRYLYISIYIYIEFENLDCHYCHYLSICLNLPISLSSLDDHPGAAGRCCERQGTRALRALDPANIRIIDVIHDN